MPATKKKPAVVTVPGVQPTPDPLIARPVTVPKKPQASKKTKSVFARTRIGVIADKSGSMEHRAGDVIGGFNQYVEDQKALPTADTTTLSLVLFDTHVQKVYLDKPIKEVPVLTDTVYRIGTFTALLDAVGQTILEMDKSLGKDERALVVIMTDGLENSSREFRKATIRQMIQEREAKGNWTFVFMGADQNAFAEGGQLGISASNVLSHEGSNYRGAMASLSIGTQCYTANSAGSSKTFFIPEQDTVEVK